MSRFDRYLADYGRYHADARNEATHAIGIPIIVLSILMLAARAELFSIGGVPVDLAAIVAIAATIFYVTLNVGLGVAMGVVLALLYLIATRILGASIPIAIALFVAGWALQFLGHVWEGQRPAFTKNAVHLLVGPIWLLARALAYVGIAGHQPR
jgi:uncharacterized membrane protein YGL010W